MRLPTAWCTLDTMSPPPSHPAHCLTINSHLSGQMRSRTALYLQINSRLIPREWERLSQIKETVPVKKKKYQTHLSLFDRGSRNMLCIAVLIMRESVTVWQKTKKIRRKNNIRNQNNRMNSATHVNTFMKNIVGLLCGQQTKILTENSFLFVVWDVTTCLIHDTSLQDICSLWDNVLMVCGPLLYSKAGKIQIMMTITS